MERIWTQRLSTVGVLYAMTIFVSSCSTGATPRLLNTPSPTVDTKPISVLTPMPVATQTLMVAIHVCKNSQTKEGAQVFEDFNDQQTQWLVVDGGKWQFVSDENSNFVYDTQTAAGAWSNLKVARSLGASNAIDIRARVIDTKPTTFPQISLAFRRTEATASTKEAYYVLALFTSNNKFELNYSEDGNWIPLNERLPQINYQFTTNKWYDIHIETHGSDITVKVGDDDPVTVSDSRLVAGDLRISVGPETHAQIDELCVAGL